MVPPREPGYGAVVRTKWREESGLIHSMNWRDELAALMDVIETKDPKAAINEIVDLSASVPEEEAGTFFREDSAAGHYAVVARQVYSEYILRMENAALDNILAMEIRSGMQFGQVADPEAKMAFDRVADIFERLILEPDMRFVMIGCGQLPVTAIHVIERAGCANVICMDVVERAIDASERLKAIFGWPSLHPVHCDGKDFDFGNADVVYIANMVRPKGAVIEQVARTAPPGCQIVVREPYGLGRLWADLGEASLPESLFVSSYGNGSRYLSRDAFLSWHGLTSGA
ncbi:MAG: hypothetical protein R3E09_02060 [Novosphingobium sp.]